MWARLIGLEVRVTTGNEKSLVNDERLADVRGKKSIVSFLKLLLFVDSLCAKVSRGRLLI